MSKQQVSNEKQLSGIWKGMVQYLQSQNQSQTKTSYRVRYSNEEDLEFTFDNVVIQATCRLEAVIKLKEFLTVNEKYPYTLSAFQDDCFNDILYDYDDIDAHDIESIFKNRNIDEIIARFVDVQFTNDSLWLEQ
jgi:hypothetical protein